MLLAIEEDTGLLWKLEQDITGSWREWQSFDEHPTPGERLDASTVALNAKGQLELWFTIRDTMDLYRRRGAS